MIRKLSLFPLLLQLLTASIVQAQEQNPLVKENISAEMEVLSWSPRIFVYRNFLTEEECDYLIEKAKPHLTPSTVVDDENNLGSKTDYRRSSEGMWFVQNHGDLILESIEQKISLLTHIPPENGENIQILHYNQGGEYQPHYDYFDINTTGGASYLMQGGQRVASFLMYLNTPEEGGETIFPYANVSVTPIKGDALLFFNCQINGSEDPITLHGGAPVKKGEKWLATKWLRQYDFDLSGKLD